MFCRKCGTKLAPNASFCSVCGEKAVNANTANQQAPRQAAPETQPTPQQAPRQQAPQQTPQQAPRQQTPQQAPQQAPQPAPQQGGYVPPQTPNQNFNATETPAPESAPAAENLTTEVEAEPKKKKRKLRIPKKFIVLGTALALVAAIVLSFAFIPPLRRFWENNIYRPIAGSLVKTFGSDEDYFQFVEKQAFDSYGGYINTATSVYGALMDTTMGDDTYFEASVGVNIGDDAFELLEEATGVDMDLSFLNETEFKISGGKYENLIQFDSILEINGEEIINPSVLLDMDKEEIFISLLALSDKYIRADAEGIGMDFSALTAASESFLDNEALKKAIPDEGDLNDLIAKYIKIALDEIEGVEVGEDELEVGEIEEKLTTVEIAFTEELGVKMLKAVLEELKDDKDIKSYINDLAKVLEDEDMLEDSEEVYEMFVESIDDALDTMEDVDASDDAIFTLIDYVDSSHKIVGRAVFEGDDTDEDPMFFYATVHDGKNYEFELSVPMVGVAITGNGVDKGGELTGDYVVSVGGKDYVKLSLEEFDVTAIAQGKIKGKITVSPSKDLLKELGVSGMEYQGIAIADLALQLDLDIAKKKADIAVNLLVDKEVFVGIEFAYKISSAPKFEVPSGKDVLDMDDAGEWVESVDLKKFIETLKDAKLPSDIIDYAEYLASELEDMDLSDMNL